jgi:hypothetical protein
VSGAGRGGPGGWRARLSSPDVVVYTRQGCGLCRTAEEHAAAEVAPDHLRLVDVDGDEALTRRYHVRVPVVVVDGREVAEGRVAAGEIAAAVRAARWRRLRRGGR